MRPGKPSTAYRTWFGGGDRQIAHGAPGAKVPAAISASPGMLPIAGAAFGDTGASIVNWRWKAPSPSNTWMWSKIGLTNSYVPLIVPHWLGFHVFYIFLLRQFFKNLPRELDEAAIIDGAHVLQVFWFIVLPLSRPALIVVAILSALFAWNDFLDPLVYISDGDKYTLALGLTQFTGLFTSQWNLLMAATTVIIVPVLLVFFLTQRYFIAGVTMSGLKG